MRLSDKYPFLTDYFTKALTAANRALPQSILFYGNDLNSQYILATEIARFLNCLTHSDRVPSPQPSPEGGSSHPDTLLNDEGTEIADDCDCINCRWIREGTHPAVMTISKTDNKPEDDDSKTVISVKQSQMIKEMLVNASEFHRVFIFCDRDEDGNISGLNPQNFQADAANSLLKIIEEPQPGVTFIFLTRYIDDVLSTIISRSQCFFVPSFERDDYDYSMVEGVFTDYLNFERKDAFDISQNLQTLSAEHSVKDVLSSIQNYMLALLKSNPQMTEIIKHIELVERAKTMADVGIKPANIFDDLCLKIIKK